MTLLIPAMMCPKLSAPKHGYFVQKCENVFNAGCGIRCDHGYKLIGKSLRLCKEDGTWSGEEGRCEGIFFPCWIFLCDGKHSSQLFSGFALVSKRYGNEDNTKQLTPLDEVAFYYRPKGVKTSQGSVDLWHIAIYFVRVG